LTGILLIISKHPILFHPFDIPPDLIIGNASHPSKSKGPGSPSTERRSSASSAFDSHPNHEQHKQRRRQRHDPHCTRPETHSTLQTLAALYYRPCSNPPIFSSLPAVPTARSTAYRPVNQICFHYNALEAADKPSGKKKRNGEKREKQIKTTTISSASPAHRKNKSFSKHTYI
jgi:hypothetical protein